MKQTDFTSHDGNRIALYTWDDVVEPKAVVKIAHGMVEHSARYDDFAKFLTASGYIGGEERPPRTRIDGRRRQSRLRGRRHVYQQCQRPAYPDKLLPRKVQPAGIHDGTQLRQFRHASGCRTAPRRQRFCACRRNYIKGVAYSVCKTVARSMCRNKGPRHEAVFIADLSFKPYDKHFKARQKRWAFNRDKAEVEKYNHDPFCTYVCSANFYRTFMEGISKLYKKQYYQAIDVTKPILLVAGSEDPVGNYGKGVKKLAKFYENTVGVTDVTTCLYDGARHEILNEINKNDVYADIADWLDKHM